MVFISSEGMDLSFWSISQRRGRASQCNDELPRRVGSGIRTTV